MWYIIDIAFYIINKIKEMREPRAAAFAILIISCAAFIILNSLRRKKNKNFSFCAYKITYNLNYIVRKFISS